jgi:hypothetical protein
MYARFISTEFIYNTTIIDSNVDATLVNKFIDMSQDINIQQVLGHDLYHKLMDLVANNTITDVNNKAYYNLLVDYVQKTQAYWLVYNILPYINYHLTNKSVTTKSSDSSQATGLPELEFLRSDSQSKAEFYVARIRELIVNDPSSYPEYFTTAGIDRITPKALNYFGGLYLPNRIKLPINGVNISNDGQFGGYGGSIF